MVAFEEVLARQRVKPRPEWLRGVLATFGGGGGEAWQQAPPTQVDEHVFAQLLRSDLAASLAGPALPDPLVDGELRGPVLLQVSLFFLHSTALLALLPLVARNLQGGDAGTFTAGTARRADGIDERRRDDDRIAAHQADARETGR